MKFQRETNGSCSASSLKHSMKSILTIDDVIWVFLCRLWRGDSSTATPTQPEGGTRISDLL